MTTKTRRVLGRQQLKERQDREYDYVDLDDLPGFEPGDCIRLQSLTAGERVSAESKAVGHEKMPDGSFQRFQNPVGLRERLIAHAMVDDTGAPVYNTSTESSVQAAIAELGDRNTKVIQRVFDALQRLSGMAKGAESAAGEDSAGARKNGSSSDSPATSASAPSLSSDGDSVAVN